MNWLTLLQMKTVLTVLPVPTDLGNNAVITILAKFTEGTVEQPKKTLSLGVGVNVSHTKHSNNAYIKKGNITAGSLNVSAVSWK